MRAATAQASKSRARQASKESRACSTPDSASEEEEWCGGQALPLEEPRRLLRRLALSCLPPWARSREEARVCAERLNGAAGPERAAGQVGAVTAEKQRRRTMLIMTDRRERLSKGQGTGGSFAADRKRSTLHSMSFQELAEDITDSSGVLVDYILRYRARLAKQAKETNKGWTRYEVEELGKFLSALSQKYWEGFEYAGQQISIEKLTTDIMTAVTREAKRAGIWKTVSVEAGGSSSSCAVVRASALQICAWKKEEACLRAEVDNFILRYKLLHNKVVVPMRENMWERKARMEGFFADFHSKKDTPLDPATLAQVAGVQPWGDAARSALTAPGDERRPPRSSSLVPPKLGGASMRTTNFRVTAGAGRGDGRPKSEQLSSRWGTPPAIRTTQLSQGSRAAPPMRSKQITQTSSLPNLLGRVSKHEASKDFTGKPWPWERSAGPTSASSKTFASKTSERSAGPISAAPKTFTSKPWESCAGATSAKGESTKLPTLTGHQKRYLQECDTSQCVPIPLAFVTGHSKKFEANGRDLVDQELIAMAGMLNDATVIEVTDLSFNSLLSDAGLVPFLQQLSSGPAVQTLQQLLLSSCVRAGTRTVESIMQLIGTAGNLRMLDLSHVRLNSRLQAQLCKAIGRHNVLETINLADTGMNSTYVAKQCIGELLGSKSITGLDLSWNCSSSETFLNLGEALTKSCRVRSLKLANCSATMEEGKDTPVALFLESLSRETGLAKLDVAMNRIDHQTFLIIEDSLDRHPNMQELDVSNNALGVHGIRSALRLIARDTNEITKIYLEGCFTGATTVGGEDSEAVFSATSPGGRYVLFLDRACHRALLRMLYRIADKFGLSPGEAFIGVAYTPINASGKAMGKPEHFSHPVKEADGLRAVPVSGKLELVLDMQRCLEKAIYGLEDEDCDGFLAQYFQIVRYQPGWKKMIPILANLKMVKQSTLQQQVFLDALAKDFRLTVPMLAAMCASNRLFAKDIVCRTMPCAPHDAASRFLGHMIVPSFSDFLWTHQRMQALLNFNAGNPTGHYKLYLDNCCDYAVADRLCLLDRWESAIDNRSRYFDTSKWGNRSHFRNELHRGRPIIKDGVASMAEWNVPESGELELDYATNRRPKAKKATLSDSLWDHVLVSLYDAQTTLEGGALMQVVRRISHNISLTSMHLRKMLGYFKHEEERAECFVVFFFRIVDVCNAKMFSCRFSKQEEVVKLQERLGYASFFPFMQPENAHFSLDLSQNDQRVCANLLVNLACKEKRENLRNPQFYLPDGSADPTFQKQGVPARWQFLDKMPTQGRFVCHYVCAPEDRKYEPRRRSAENYGHYAISTSEADVQWWTGLLEVPEDVLRLMEFIMSNFKNVDEAFNALDWVDGNGEISFLEMLEGLGKMKFRKFEGKDERDRVMSVFRYLDPGGEGTITRNEWGILGQLWREFDLTVREFVHFMVIAFGEDLEQTWEVLDPLGSGSLDLEQWNSSVEDIGFFGPAEIIFALLDASDDGEISYEEFSKLWKYVPVGGGSSSDEGLHAS